MIILYLLLIFFIDLILPKDFLVSLFNKNIYSLKIDNRIEQKPIGITPEWQIIIHPQPIQAGSKENTIQSKTKFAFDLNSGLILDSDNQDTQMPIASLTKLMTAYITLKNTSLDEIIKVPYYETRSGDSQAGLIPGEQLTVKAALYGLLLNSGSDAAQTLATNIGDSQSSFVDKMNQASSDLSLSNTHFANPVGWDDNNNYSSSRDITTLIRILLANNDFRDIVSTKYITINTLDNRSIQLSNTNLLLDENFLGVKTGNTFEAGECLASLYKSNTTSLLTVLINSSDRFGETKTYLDWIKGTFLW